MYASKYVSMIITMHLIIFLLVNYSNKLIMSFLVEDYVLVNTDISNNQYIVIWMDSMKLNSI